MENIKNLQDEELSYKVYCKVAYDFVGNIFFYGFYCILIYFILYKVLKWLLLAKFALGIFIIITLIDILSVCMVLLTGFLAHLKEIIDSIRLKTKFNYKSNFFYFLSSSIRVLEAVLMSYGSYILFIRIFR